MFSLQINTDCTIRLLKEDDAKELFALVDTNRAHLRSWLGWLDHNKSLEDTRQYIRKASDQHKQNDGFQCGIWYQSKLAGIIGFHEVDWVNHKTSMGYWLGENFQGKGLVTSACRELVLYAIKEWKLNRIELRCGSHNARSQHVAEKLGFHKEGVLRQAEWLYDHYEDLIVYSVLAAEFKIQPSSDQIV